MRRALPSRDAFQAALSAALASIQATHNLIRAGAEGSPIPQGVRAFLIEYQSPYLKTSNPQELDQEFLLARLEQFEAVLREHAGCIDLVRDRLLGVATTPQRLADCTRATAHELAWDFALGVRRNINRILHKHPDCDAALDLDKCRIHWRAIELYLWEQRRLDVLVLGAAVRIESARAQERFGIEVISATPPSANATNASVSHLTLEELSTSYDHRALEWFCTPECIQRPSPSLPTGINLLRDEGERRRLAIVWDDVHRLLFALETWQQWFQELQDEGDANPSVALSCRKTALQAIRGLSDLVVEPEPFSRLPVETLSKILPLLPDWWRGRDGRRAEDEPPMAGGTRPRWQEDPSFLEDYEREDGRRAAMLAFRRDVLKLRTWLEQSPLPVGGVSPSTEIPATPLKLPSPEAIQAYRLHFLKGVPTQQEIADRLSAEFRHPISQGQISRWLREVAAYIEKGGVLPKMSAPVQNATSIDPAVIEVGRRQVRNVKRQHDRGRDH